MLDQRPTDAGSPKPIRAKLIEMAEQILAKNSINRAIAADDSLTDSGLSSIDMVNLMLAIEAEFNVLIPPSDISPENFRSVSTIEALVVKVAASSR
jgi:acyl carrier protein